MDYTGQASGNQPPPFEPRQEQVATEQPIIPNNATSPGPANSIVVKSGAGVLAGFTVFNSNAGSQFILLFDTNAVPANAAVPILAFTVAGGQALAVNWIPGRVFRSGCVLCNSSTSTTKTIGAADCLFDVQYT